MSDNNGEDAQEASRAFVKHLENSGFFNQIKDLESNLTKIAEELQSFGQATQARMEESENLAAHILAIESILAVVLKSSSVTLEDVKAEVKDRTAVISGVEEGSPSVHAIAEDIVKRGQS
tara:strand:+ start:550 stop:909 length:360 start_codon:yes stop_codon:yes gene_type:complete